MKFDRNKFMADAIALSQRQPPIRWLHQGRDPDTGLDCIGFLRWLVIQQMPLPAELEAEFNRPYHMIFDGQRLLATMRRWLPELERSEITPGDIMLFYRKNNPQHVAVVLPANEVVEAVIYRHAGISGILKQPLDTTRRLVAAFRIPDEWSALT